jgi:predicted nucleic acid-binding protein
VSVLPTALLLDTCSIINLSYRLPIALAFKERYSGRAGWVRAVQTELTNQRLRRPPHPQAGRASNWAVSWLGQLLGMTDLVQQMEVERIQRSISVGGSTSAADHLGEAVSIVLLKAAGAGRLISDDHGARDEARRNGVLASSTVGVIAQLLTITNGALSSAQADTYLETLRARGRMNASLTSLDLLSGELGAWR